MNVTDGPCTDTSGTTVPAAPQSLHAGGRRRVRVCCRWT